MRFSDALAADGEIPQATILSRVKRVDVLSKPYAAYSTQEQLQIQKQRLQFSRPCRLYTIETPPPSLFRSVLMKKDSNKMIFLSKRQTPSHTCPLVAPIPTTYLIE